MEYTSSDIDTHLIEFRKLDSSTQYAREEKKLVEGINSTEYKD